MTTATPPLPTMKSIYDQVETFWSKPLHAMLGTESAAAAMSMVREQALTQQANQRAQLESTWEALRLPSKVDHARLAGQVVALEAKIEGVEDRLDLISQQLERLIAQTAMISTNTTKQERKKEA
ncbi:MAG: hypothetical protein JWM80_3704 [Cyanobacteria bacterium RYN_339]|nr:hypothetical protein [Cyanobacteria bacterium RYN_339]